MEDTSLTLTVGETAEILGLSRAFTYELVARGELPCVRFGRRIVIPRVAIERLLEDAAEPGTPRSQRVATSDI
jgi:excisionase family DNA binding protein